MNTLIENPFITIRSSVSDIANEVAYAFGVAESKNYVLSEKEICYLDYIATLARAKNIPLP